MSIRSKVFIDPTSRILYSSYYIKGLYDKFGRQNVFFSLKYFRSLKRHQDARSYDHYMAFVVVNSGVELKIVIDFHDSSAINANAYDWADKYAKININPQSTDSKYDKKLISIPPSFGIRIWNFMETGLYCMLNRWKSRSVLVKDLRTILSDYVSQYRRPSIEQYNISGNQSSTCYSISEKPYVFMIATLWLHKNCLEGANLLRKTFFEVCQSVDCIFEGGFSASVDHPQYSEFKHLVFSKRYAVSDYLKKTALSALVFNTPAVHNCHGWKLGEFLALGKAIISTPLSNRLPVDLIHGFDIHIIDNIDELKQSIELILEDSAYRKSLEDAANKYYTRYANPFSVIDELVKGIF